MYKGLRHHKLTARLFHMSRQGLENLQLDLGLSNILLASAAVGDLLGLSDLSSDGLSAEVLKGVTLDGVDAKDGVGLNGSESTREEELLRASGLLDNLNQTRLQLLNGRNVVGEDTHLSRLGGDVDLDDIVGLVDRLVREGKAQLDLVGDGLGVGSSLEGNSDGGRASSESRTGDAERVHDGLSWWVRLLLG
jgi:hypothetical protein